MSLLHSSPTTSGIDLSYETANETTTTGEPHSFLVIESRSMTHNVIPGPAGTPPATNMSAMNVGIPTKKAILSQSRKRQDRDVYDMPSDEDDDQVEPPKKRGRGRPPKEKGKTKGKGKRKPITSRATKKPRDAESPQGATTSGETQDVIHVTSNSFVAQDEEKNELAEEGDVNSEPGVRSRLPGKPQPAARNVHNKARPIHEADVEQQITQEMAEHDNEKVVGKPRRARTRFPQESPRKPRARRVATIVDESSAAEAMNRFISAVDAAEEPVAEADVTPNFVKRVRRKKAVMKEVTPAEEPEELPEKGQNELFIIELPEEDMVSATQEESSSPRPPIRRRKKRRLTHDTVVAYNTEPEAEGTPDYDHLPSPLSKLRTRLFEVGNHAQSFTEKLSNVSTSHNQLINLLCVSHGRNIGLYPLVSKALENLKSDVYTEEEVPQVLGVLDEALGRISLLKEGQDRDVKGVVALHKRAHTVSVDCRKPRDDIITVFRQHRYISRHDPFADPNARKNERKRVLAICDEWNKRIEDELRERVVAQRGKLRFPSGRSGSSPEVERVVVEAFGTRRKPGNSAADEMVLEDRPWTDEETAALIRGMEKYQGDQRFRLIRQNWREMLSGRSEGDMRVKATEIRMMFVEGGVHLEDWWYEGF
jgi:hypothetical protein